MRLESTLSKILDKSFTVPVKVFNDISMKTEVPVIENVKKDVYNKDQRVDFMRFLILRNCYDKA